MIKLQEVNKKFAQNIAVDNLSLHIRSAEIFGLLGSNGAGKTTTMRIMTLLSQINSGKVYIANEDIFQNPTKIKPLIGVVPQHFSLEHELTARENLILHARLYHINPSKQQEIINSTLEFMELEDHADRLVKNYSGGMKRRLMIGAALMHNPKILFLDEPTVGLDAQVRRKIWDSIRLKNKEGMTIVLTTHYIEEAEELCQRVAIMQRGKLLALDEVELLKSKYGKYLVEWFEKTQRKTKFFQHLNEAKLFTSKLDMESRIKTSNLEDVFVELTGRKLND